jgi:hypothetical protein
MINKFVIFITVILLTTSCGGAFKPKKVDTRETPINAMERAKKNINQGKGTSIGDLVTGRRGNTTYEFSTANPMWRASLEILDFLPLTTVDYSGGMIITDWYSENSTDDSIKITLRFLSNEIRSENLKVIVHKKTCTTKLNCKTVLLKNGKINEELLSSIIRKAARLEKESKSK